MIVRTLVGTERMEVLRPAWDSLADGAECPVFQSWAWGRAWLRSVGAKYEPRLIVAGDPPTALLPLAARSRAGLRILTLLGHGISDYLGPITADPSMGEVLAEALIRESRGFDLVDLRGLCATAPASDRFIEAIMPGAVCRDYERCPAVDTTSGWDEYLRTRKTKFRTNLKRTFRKVEQLGKVTVQIERSSPELFNEMLGVERSSWKWQNGLAFTRHPATREFLRLALHDPAVRSEIWTCRINSRLAGFSVVFPTSRTRHYYLPSYRDDSWGVGTYLLAAIIEDCCESDFEEFDFLQGDESYKFPWATHERSVQEIALRGGRALSMVAFSAIRFRWWIARSSRAHALRRRLVSARRLLGRE